MFAPSSRAASPWALHPPRLPELHLMPPALPCQVHPHRTPGLRSANKDLLLELWPGPLVAGGGDLEDRAKLHKSRGGTDRKDGKDRARAS